MKIGKTKSKYVIIIRNNKTNKTKSLVFDNGLKDETEVLNLIKELLIKYYEEKNAHKHTTIKEKGTGNIKPLLKKGVKK